MKPIWEFLSENDWLAHVRRSLDEDFGSGIGAGDHSTLACVGPTHAGGGILRAKEAGIVAGISLVPSLLREVDPHIQWHPSVVDGQSIAAGEILGTATGPTVSLLGVERTLLNYLQRLSGIATQTQRCVDLVAETGVQLLDTRKTTPGWRALEKWAVQVGGAQNHRMGLHDYVMLKDNHIDAAGSITEAVLRTVVYLKKRGLTRDIEVEARCMKDVEEALALTAVTRIMLDNFSPESCALAVQRIGGQKETEASGGITEATIVHFAQSGVDYISLGALTHSVKSLDIHFKVCPL